MLGKAGLKGDPNGRQASSQGLPSLHNKGSGRGVIEENLKKRRGEVSPCEPRGFFISERGLLFLSNQSALPRSECRAPVVRGLDRIWRLCRAGLRLTFGPKTDLDGDRGVRTVFPIRGNLVWMKECM